MFKQVIIARKDLGMSPGKLAAQVSHASIAFLTDAIKQGEITYEEDGTIYVECALDVGVYEGWINGSFTKVILEAKNREQLEKAMRMADEMGIKYYTIVDNCRTELEKETEQGTLTCIGFPPMEEEEIDKIGKKFQLWKA